MISGSAVGACVSFLSPPSEVSLISSRWSVYPPPRFGQAGQGAEGPTGGMGGLYGPRWLSVARLQPLLARVFGEGLAAFPVTRGHRRIAMEPGDSHSPRLDVVSLGQHLALEQRICHLERQVGLWSQWRWWLRRVYHWLWTSSQDFPWWPDDTSDEEDPESGVRPGR